MLDKNCVKNWMYMEMERKIVPGVQEQMRRFPLAMQFPCPVKETFRSLEEDMTFGPSRKSFALGI